MTTEQLNALPRRTWVLAFVDGRPMSVLLVRVTRGGKGKHSIVDIPQRNGTFAKTRRALPNIDILRVTKAPRGFEGRE